MISAYAHEPRALILYFLAYVNFQFAKWSDTVSPLFISCGAMSLVFKNVIIMFSWPDAAPTSVPMFESR